MTTLIYNGSFPGYMTSVSHVLVGNQNEVRIVKEDAYQPQIFDHVIHVANDIDLAEKLWGKLKAKLSSDSLLNLYSCFLSELPEAEMLMLSFIKLVLTNKVGKHQDYGDATVLRVAQIGKCLFREKHRFEAFARFQRLQDNLYYATIEPDFNVLPLLVKHFRSRYADQKWLIYDCKRNYGVYFDLKTVSEVLLDIQKEEDGLSSAVLHPEEERYQVLWKDYFKSVNIESKNNKKLHIQHMPKRYWKHLTEKMQ